MFNLVRLNPYGAERRTAGRALKAAVLLVAALALPGAAQGSSDPANRIKGASDAASNSVLAGLPLPMTDWTKGNWHVGVSAGYAKIEAGVFDFKGPGVALGWSWAALEGKGLYAVGFYNELKAAGGGNEPTATPWVQSPVSFTAAEFSNIGGSVKQYGAGLTAAMDFAHGSRKHAVPGFVGLMVNSTKVDAFTMDYTATAGTNSGQKGVMKLDGTYTFVMPLIGISYSYLAWEDWALRPSIVAAFPLGTQGSMGSLTGTAPSVFAVSGDTEGSGVSEANFGKRPIWSLGFVVEYKPWGLSANLGATLFKLALASSLIDEIDTLTYFNLAYGFGR